MFRETFRRRSGGVWGGTREVLTGKFAARFASFFVVGCGSVVAEVAETDADADA